MSSVDMVPQIFSNAERSQSFSWSKIRSAETEWAIAQPNKCVISLLGRTTLVRQLLKMCCTVTLPFGLTDHPCKAEVAIAGMFDEALLLLGYPSLDAT
jgi:hypothetical protein